MRKIIFLVQDDNCGATFMLGKMLKHGLDHYNIENEVAHINNFTENFSALEDIKDSLVFIFKHVPHKIALKKLKENNNKIVMDVVDEFVRPGTTPENLYSYILFDGVIIRANKILKDYTFPPHLETVNIPHHWDIRLQNLDTSVKTIDKPMVTINDGRDMPHIKKLIEENHIQFIGNFSYQEFAQLTDKLNSFTSCYNVRATDSAAYKFKPATKLVTSAALNIPIITNYDWSVQDLLPPDYPFLTEGKNYEEIVNIISTFPEPGSKEYKYAQDILRDVKSKTAMINLIPQYIEFYKRF